MFELITERLTEEILEDRTIGGIDYTLKRVLDDYVIEENILGEIWVNSTYDSLSEARFAFEVLTGQQVAISQDYGSSYDADGDPIGYYESTQPFLY